MSKLKKKHIATTEFNIRCSKCGEFINKDGGNGIAVWTEKYKNTKEEPFSIFHKGSCDNENNFVYSADLMQMFRGTRKK